MKRLTLILILICIILRGGTAIAEIGDAVFRPKGVQIPGIADFFNFYHAGLYVCSDGRMDWDPEVSIINTDLTHSVIQALGKDTSVAWYNFSYFGAPGYGYTYPGGLSVMERKRIIKKAREQYGAKYPWPMWPPDSNQWYYPKIMTPNRYDSLGNIIYGCFRCDGLVEYVYEQVGKGLFTEEEKFHCHFWDSGGNWIGWPVFYPRALMARMEEDFRFENEHVPDMEVFSPKDGDEVIDSIKVRFNCYDEASGIDFVIIKVDGKVVYMEDSVDYDGMREVEYSWECSGLSLGRHYVYIGATDRAGHLSYRTIWVYKGEAPYVVSTDPSNNENNVLIDKGKVIIKFSKPMDENTTEAAFSIIGTNGNGVPVDSFAWEDSNKTMKVFIDTLDYFTEYRVTITDDAMSVNKRLLKNFNMYKIWA